MATGTIKKVTNESGISGGNNKSFCKMPDGTLIQWGESDNITINTHSLKDTQIAFPLPFNENYGHPTVLANCYASMTPYTEVTGPSVISIGQEQFKCRFYNNYSSNLDIKFTWLAIGHWK